MSCRLLETSKISQLEKIKIFLNNQGYISVEDGMYLRFVGEGKIIFFLGQKVVGRPTLIHIRIVE